MKQLIKISNLSGYLIRLLETVTPSKTLLYSKYLRRCFKAISKFSSELLSWNDVHDAHVHAYRHIFYNSHILQWKLADSWKWYVNLATTTTKNILKVNNKNTRKKQRNISKVNNKDNKNDVDESLWCLYCCL